MIKYILLTLFLIIFISFTISYISFRKDIKVSYEKLNELKSIITDTPYSEVEYAVSSNKGYPVLMIHGAAGGFDQGLDFALGFTDSDYRVISPSRFGYLGSTMPRDATPKMQADAFISMLDKLEIERVAVMTVSAGGCSAVQLALNYPERVSALIMISTAIADKPLALPPKPVVKGMISSDYIFWLLSHPFRSLTSRMFLPKTYELNQGESAELDALMSGLLPIKPRSNGLLFDIFVTNTDPHNKSSEYMLENIKVPTLIINAKDDPSANYEDAKQMSRRIQNAKFISIKEGGHMMFGSGDLIKEEINKFLDKNAK